MLTFILGASLTLNLFFLWVIKGQSEDLDNAQTIITSFMTEDAADEAEPDKHDQ